MSPVARQYRLENLVPALFVFLWSTGFIGSKMGMPYIEPFTFLLVRFLLVIVVMVPFALACRAPWPRDWVQIGHIAMVGILMHGFYLGGVFASIAAGLPAGISALVTGLQPLLTAFLAVFMLGERVRLRQWIGLVLGFVGVTMVVAEKVNFGMPIWEGLPWSIGAVFGISVATLYQKKYCGSVDLRTGTVIQFAAASVPMAILSFWMESRAVTWSWDLIIAMAWLVLVMSVGAVSLLMHLIRLGAATKLGSLFYLVPPTTAFIAYLMFGETLAVLALFGVAVTAFGVALATRG